MKLTDLDGRPITTQRQFHCRCDKCKAIRPPIYNHPKAKNLSWSGKLWQANYGEPQRDFVKRVKDWHRVR